jgi:hypothetical protein
VKLQIATTTRPLSSRREREHAVVAIVADQPREAGRIAVERMQRRLGRIRAVQVAHEPLHAGARARRADPVRRRVVRELRPLRELAAHEQQLLARMRPHEAEVRAQRREPLPRVAGHFRGERALAVHDLVVRQRQHEALGERIDEPERHPVVVIAAMDRVFVQIRERVVHPAHVPFEIEAEAAVAGRRGHARHAVDSSAIVTTPAGAAAPCSASLSVRRNATDSRFSRPPYTFGTHSPSLRE